MNCCSADASTAWRWGRRSCSSHCPVGYSTKGQCRERKRVDAWENFLDAVWTADELQLSDWTSSRGLKMAHWSTSQEGVAVVQAGDDKTLDEQLTCLSVIQYGLWNGHEIDMNIRAYTSWPHHHRDISEAYMRLKVLICIVLYWISGTSLCFSVWTRHSEFLGWRHTPGLPGGVTSQPSFHDLTGGSVCVGGV